MPKTKTKTPEVTTVSEDIVVRDPQILRPKELPLVITPAEGKEWANEAQAEFASYLNAYAYKNPEKWDAKKPALLAQLRDLAEHPEKLVVLKGGEDQNLSYRNQIIQS